MKPILMGTDNIYIDTAVKLFQSWWLMWANLFTLKPVYNPNKETPPIVVIIPIFMRF